MNKEFKILDNKVIVFDEYRTKTTREISSNIEEILISENDIEKMEEMIEEENSIIKDSKKKIRNKGWYYFPLSSIWLTNATLHFCMNKSISLVLGSLFGLNAVLQGGLGLMYILPERKYIKIQKKKIDIIKKHINEEKKNLKRLENENNNDTNYINMSNTNLSTSEKIDKLKDYLYVINQYNINKRHYIRYFKKGELKKHIWNYSDDEFKLLEELIKNDIGNENTKEKTLTK